MGQETFQSMQTRIRMALCLMVLLSIESVAAAVPTILIFPDAQYAGLPLEDIDVDLSISLDLREENEGCDLSRDALLRELRTSTMGRELSDATTQDVWARASSVDSRYDPSPSTAGRFELAISVAHTLTDLHLMSSPSRMDGAVYQNGGALRSPE